MPTTLAQNTKSLSQALEAEGGGPESDITILELSRKLRGYDYCVGLAFLVSLAAFPSIVACICSVQNGATVAPCRGHPPAGRFYGGSQLPILDTRKLCVDNHACNLVI